MEDGETFSYCSTDTTDVSDDKSLSSPECAQLSDSKGSDTDCKAALYAGVAVSRIGLGSALSS